RATTTVPETGFVEPQGPSLTQDEALMLRHMGVENPLLADTDTIAAARQLVSENPELMARLRSGTPEKPPAPAAPQQPTAASAQTLDEIAREQYGKPYTELNDQQQVRAYDRWQSTLKPTPTPPGGTVAQTAPAVTAPATTIAPAAEDPVAWVRQQIA